MADRGIGCFTGGLIFVAAAYFLNPTDPNNPDPPSMTMEQAGHVVALENAVKTRLRDPDSAQFKHLGRGCGYVNARNGFGGYTGYRRFIAQEGGDAGIEDGDNALKFKKLWREYCATATDRGS